VKRLVPQSTLVLVIDIQERLAAAMPPAQMEALVRATRIIVEGARLLGAPVVFTEQYPKGLGATIEPVAGVLDAAHAQRFEKICFSAGDLSAFRETLSASGVEAAVVVGMETHVCVYQTVRDLVASGLTVHVPMDGVASRREDHRQMGLELCQRAGAHPSTAESIAFDWLREAGSDPFKQLSKLIR